MVTTQKSHSVAKRKTEIKGVPALHCSFCGRGQHVANLLVKGLNNACICDACVELARNLVGASRLGILPEHGPNFVKQMISTGD
jgi:hypothetical protein